MDKDILSLAERLKNDIIIDIGMEDTDDLKANISSINNIFANNSITSELSKMSNDILESLRSAATYNQSMSDLYEKLSQDWKKIFNRSDSYVSDGEKRCNEIQSGILPNSESLHYNIEKVEGDIQSLVALGDIISARRLANKLIKNVGDYQTQDEYQKTPKLIHKRIQYANMCSDRVGKILGISNDERNHSSTETEKIAPRYVEYLGTSTDIVLKLHEWDNKLDSISFEYGIDSDEYRNASDEFLVWFKRETDGHDLDEDAAVALNMSMYLYQIVNNKDRVTVDEIEDRISDDEKFTQSVDVVQESIPDLHAIGSNTVQVDNISISVTDMTDSNSGSEGNIIKKIVDKDHNINEPICQTMIGDHVDYILGNGSHEPDKSKSFLLGTADYDFFTSRFAAGVDVLGYPFVIDPFGDCYVLCGDCLCYVGYNKQINKLSIGKMFQPDNTDAIYSRRYYPDGSYRGTIETITSRDDTDRYLFSKADSKRLPLKFNKSNYRYWDNAFVCGNFISLYMNVNGVTFSPCDGFNILDFEDRYLQSVEKVYMSFSYGRLAYVTPCFNKNNELLGLAIGQKCTTIVINPGGTDITVKSPMFKSRAGSMKKMFKS